MTAIAQWKDAEKPEPEPQPQPRPSYGGVALTTYQIKVEEREGAEVTTNYQETYPGTRIFVTVELAAGRELEKILVTDDKGTEIYVVPEINGTYSFSMPSANVTVKAVLEGDVTEGELPFTDLTEDMDCYDDVKYVYEKGIMIGMSDTEFGADKPLTRGMIVTVLYRMEGEPEVEYTGKFSDVADDKWYTDGVEWAAANGIVFGYGDDTYGPTDNVTREQLAAILYRYANWKGYELEFDAMDLADAREIAGYAIDPVNWATYQGALMVGSNNCARPKEDANRAEIARAIRVLLETIAE